MHAPFKTRRHLTRLRLFTRAEDGGMIVLGMVFLVLMIMIGGLAVDLMRFEATRVQLQQTTDRAVLAAASLKQNLDPEDVVEDYFLKAGLADKLKSVSVTETFNMRSVRVTAAADVPPYFVQMIGITSLEAPSASTATERITDVEVSLVLDITGSMQGQKLIDLKDAANEFVSLVLNTPVNDRISISLVPYNAQVNLGPTLRSKYNVSDLHGVAGADCIDLPASVFTSPLLSRTVANPQAGYFDASTGASSSNTYQAIPAIDNNNVPCRISATAVVRPYQNTISTLQGHINALVAEGTTSIELGMKWGLTLLEPSNRPLITELIGDNVIPPVFDDRPYDYRGADKMKVIVLMTDGENVAENLLKSPYRTGFSPIWRSTGDGMLSIHHPSYTGSTNKFWVPHRNSGAGEWMSTQWNSGGGAVQLTWPQVWETTPMRWVARQLYARGLGIALDDTGRDTLYTNQMNAFRGSGNAGTKNTRLQQICTQAKNNGVVVFGVAFQAPSIGQQMISQCSSAGSAFNAESRTQIRAAFRTIASTINRLRLTQ